MTVIIYRLQQKSCNLIFTHHLAAYTLLVTPQCSHETKHSVQFAVTQRLCNHPIFITNLLHYIFFLLIIALTCQIVSKYN